MVDDLIALIRNRRVPVTTSGAPKHIE